MHAFYELITSGRKQIRSQAIITSRLVGFETLYCDVDPIMPRRRNVHSAIDGEQPDSFADVKILKPSPTIDESVTVERSFVGEAEVYNKVATDSFSPDLLLKIFENDFGILERALG